MHQNESLTLFNRVTPLKYFMTVTKSWLLYCRISVSGQEQMWKPDCHQTSFESSFPPRPRPSLPLLLPEESSTEQSALAVC